MIEPAFSTPRKVTRPPGRPPCHPDSQTGTYREHAGAVGAVGVGEQAPDDDEDGSRDGDEGFAFTWIVPLVWSHLSSARSQWLPNHGAGTQH
jgi:hypothetical protein